MSLKHSLLVHLLWLLTTKTTQAFLAVRPSSKTILFRLAVATGDTTTEASLENAIDAALIAGQDPIPLIAELEACENAKAEPNRSPAFLGQWHVHWTNCPPPSNGQLGPFTGTSEQFIENDTTASYQNILRVPPNDWLTATLDGVYQDWDGTYLDNSGKAALSLSTDWGARHWKVTFLQLTISVLGFPLIQKEFPPDTARVWRTTYMNNGVRVVRAGKTGRLEDEVIFYTKRQPKP